MTSVRPSAFQNHHKGVGQQILHRMRTVNFRLLSLRPLNHYRKKNKDELLAYRLGRLLLEELVDGLLVVSLALAEADVARLERVVPRLTLVLVFRRHPAIVI